VSHHLKVLRETGWISGERRGTWIWYSLRPEAAARFRQLAAGIQPVSVRPAATLGGGVETALRRLPVLQER
jgi:ArsR family transcriptional regulator